MNETKLEMFDDVGSFVEGEMTIPGNQKGIKPGEPSFNTLDEPIRDTILRDLKAVGVKFAYVLFPKEKKTLLKEWDLWGPLVLCTFMAMILQGSSTADNTNDGGPEFAEVFVIVWIGSMIVTLNSKLLGGNISFFQSVCVLGYCLLPTAISLIVCRIILVVEQTYLLFFVRLTVSMVGFIWATYASMIFLGDSQKPGRKGLAVYPMCLFYFIISCSFFQSVCVLGYCLLPTAISLIVCRIILILEQTYLLFFVRLTVSMVGFMWATYASMIFLGDSQKPGRKSLAVYPMCLFYFIISCSFFQSVCVLGYCLLPTAISLIVCRIILVVEQTYLLFFVRLTVSMVGFIWATYASMIFLGDSQKPGRKGLAVYPMCLFYFIISWLVISHTSS